ncbi:MAG: MFS transporter [Acidimicrobiia bacterium]|nr:MFS transporter [Acidimicrobiia bacterium]
MNRSDEPDDPLDPPDDPRQDEVGDGAAVDPPGGHGLGAEDLEDALVDGDRAVQPGTARAALASRPFRRVFLGSLLSNTGTWMQNIVLAAWTFTLTGSETFVSLVVFAQLGPLLLFTIVGGALADVFDRRRLLLWVAGQQTVLSIVLAVVASQDDPSRVMILAIVLAIGIGQAVHAPTFTSVIPTLVPRRDLQGAVSLNSVNMNASRVVGPAIGGVIMGVWGPAAVFALNAVSYSAIIVVIATMTLPAVPPPGPDDRGLSRLLRGFAVARRDRIIGRCLVTMALFSFFCLPFVTQLAALAERNLGIDPQSAAYGLLYACFGMGALLGALSISTILAGKGLERIVRVGLAGFAVTTCAMALLREPAPAYPIALVVGFCYFATVTSLSTVVQLRVSDAERGRVMALWIMAFGGTVPVGGLLFGPLMELTSITAVMLGGVVVAVILVWFADLGDGSTNPAPAGS